MAGQPPSPCIVWFRDDLRICDHPALHAASMTGRPVICLYVLDQARAAPTKRNARPLGSAARSWLAQSLRALHKSLNAIGSSLLLRQGCAAEVVAGLARETGADTVFWNEIAHAPDRAAADQVAAALNAIGVRSQGFPGDLLVDPASLRNKDGRGLRVFAPFWRRVQALGDPPKPLPAPQSLCPGPNLASDAIESWDLEPAHPDWAGGLRETWTPGEASGQARLHGFLQFGAAGYSTDRDRLDRHGTSWLSPHLRFGEVSPRQVCRTLCGGRARRALFPRLQSGAYVRRWVPELVELPAGLIHQPRAAAPLELNVAGIELGETYPRPIIDHKAGRERALKAYAKVRAQ